jgi:hypothetical protein
MVCPEPGAITVLRREPKRAAQRIPGMGRDCDGGSVPMRKQLMKGNEAIVKSAILAGCRAFYGYPITPASEIAEAAALYMPQAGGVFCRPRAKWRPSTCSTARRRRACAP